MKILIIGGYGIFGKRLSYNLLTHYQHELIIAGRSAGKASKFQDMVQQEKQKNIQTVVLDVLQDDLVQVFAQYKPDVVVNASGPYQLQQTTEESYRVARACIQVGCHYVDLADDRGFVCAIESLDTDAKKNGVVIVSGASTVPGLTVAVIDHYAAEFSELETVSYGISPGYKTERGAATIGSILSYTGKPFMSLFRGRSKVVYGWQDLSLYNFGKPLGRRWMSNCDIPDLELLPKRYPDLKNVKFQVGLEVTILHLGLWLLSGLSRVGWVKSWSKYTRLLTRMSEWFTRLGSDSGGMFVDLYGKDKTNRLRTVSWQLVAENGVGPNVPTISAEIVINKIMNNRITPGARPCMGLFTLDEFLQTARRWNIYQKQVKS